ncbi:Fc receptor-like protein 2 [Colossoma macropomum]|uniref:Fc receptor-like protein 2 n=1 Tax=Colossoma macropomum TaxID=42526 RepID=UPI001864F070|nr:Fc receptor-like protein 2 [Colossoma macropomum]
MICLMMSLRMALLCLSLISLSVILGAFGTEWSVKYNQQEICALKGSTVFMNGTYSHPERLTVTETFWVIDPVQGVEKPDLSKDPNYSGRVEYLTDEQKHFSLKLSDVMKKDEHKYYFRVITGVEKERWLGKPGVQLRVTELHVETPGEVTEGETADLTCKTTCSLTDPTFIWYKNGRPLTTKTIKNNQLHLQTVSSEDAGSYSCAVRGYHHHSTAQNLRVRYPPKNVSVSSSPSGEIVEGSSVTLTCSSDGYPPVKIYTWFKGSTSVGEGKTYSIPNIRSEDSGEYTCQSRNDHGERNSTAVYLNVLYPPKSVSVSISPSGETVEVSSVTLTCSSNANPPVKIYTWFKEGGTSPVGSGHSYHPLQSGSYYCKAQNEIGAQNAAAVSVVVKGFSYAVIYAVAGVGCGAFLLGVICFFFIWNKRRVRKKEDLLVNTVYSEIWARSATSDAALNRSVSQEVIYANVSPSQPEENSKAESSPVKTSVCTAAVEVRVKEESQEDDVQYSSVKFHHCSPPNRYKGESVDNPSAIYSSVKRKVLNS